MTHDVDALVDDLFDALRANAAQAKNQAENSNATAALPFSQATKELALAAQALGVGAASKHE